MSAGVSRQHRYIALAVCAAFLAVMSLSPAPARASDTGAVITGAGIGLAGGLILGSALSGGSSGSGITNLGSSADAMCNTACAKQAVLAKQQNNQSLNCPTAGTHVIGCSASVTGFGTAVTGMCILNQGCKAVSTSQLGGGTLSAGNGLSMLSQVLGQALGQLMQSQAQQSTAGTTGTTGTTCTSYTETSDPTQASNPCMYYVPSAASQITTDTGGTSGSDTSASDLLEALTGNSGNSGTSETSNTSLGVASTTETANSSETSGESTGASETGQTSSNLSGQDNLLQIFGATEGSASQSQSAATSGESARADLPGVFGNILFGQNGATIFASTVGDNSAVSGFYGSDTLGGGQPQGIVGSLCAGRPWASNFLSNVIPPSFFDNLCQKAGYQVGFQAPTPTPTPTQPQVTLQQTETPAPAKTAATSTATPTVPPEARIWAVPAAVPLGARTMISWNTQGVSGCTESSPDGSFSEQSLSGTQATVPITEATTYTISCVDLSGNPVTDYVTVTIGN